MSCRDLFWFLFRKENEHNSTFNKECLSGLVIVCPAESKVEISIKVKTKFYATT